MVIASHCEKVKLAFFFVSLSHLTCKLCEKIKTVILTQYLKSQDYDQEYEILEFSGKISETQGF